MKTRILSAAVALVVLFAVLLCGNLWVFRIALAALSVIGLFELYRAFDLLGHPLPILFGWVIGAAIPILCSLKWTVVLLVLFLAVLLAVMLSDPKRFPFATVTELFFFECYVPCALACLTALRQSPAGLYAVWPVLGGAWLTDTFAYFTGRAFGKRKLCPEISPKKTVAGAIGGAVGTTVCAAIYAYAVRRFAGVELPSPLLFAGLGLALGILAQMGDLTASWIKRERGIKDYGNLMPGHGGVMDRFDSVLFTAPAAMIFLTFFG